MALSPIHNTYWVRENELLAGEYPGSPSPAEAGRKVRALLDLGVRLFVDLTEAGELEPYARHVPAGAHQRFPIRDVSVPESPSAMVRILDAIDAEVDAGRLVTVHCWGGVGRTGVVAGCWLARRSGGAAGFNALQQRWSQCAKSRHKSSPETGEQRQFILNWPAGQ